MNILIEYFELMNYKILELTNTTIKLYDMDFQEVIEKTISEATQDIIEMIESKIQQDYYNLEAKEQFTQEINQLKTLL